MEYFVYGVFATIFFGVLSVCLKWALEDLIISVIRDREKSCPPVKRWEIYDEISKHEAKKHKSKRG